MIMAAAFFMEEDDHDEEFDSNHSMLLGMKNNIFLGKHEDDRSAAGISIAERRAAKCGFNASSINAPDLLSPPYITVPQGISPSALLDSPIMLLPNTHAERSPTTGTFSSPNHECLKLQLQIGSCCEDNANIAMESSPEAEPQGIHVSDPTNFRANASEKVDYPRDLEDKMGKTEDQLEGRKSRATMMNNRNQIIMLSESKERISRSTAGNEDQKQNHHHLHPKVAELLKNKCWEDGYFWRKYGQKHVKGSLHPRSYYKCTSTNCPVTKKVERCCDGQISEIIYAGSHTHATPDQLCTKSRFSDHVISPSLSDCINTDLAAAGQDHIHAVAFTSSTSINDPQLKPNDHDQDPRNDEASPVPSSSVEEDLDHENGRECEPRKRKRERLQTETTVVPAARSTRETKVVVKIESSIDILDDGYRWRKYGQKVVKGNSNPRSYYKCTTPGCGVRKQVERAGDDKKSVITTYEGKHNHEVPVASTKTTAALLIHSDIVSTHAASTKPDLLKSDHEKQLLQVQHHHLPPFYQTSRPIFSNYDDQFNLPPPPPHDTNITFPPPPSSHLYPLSSSSPSLRSMHNRSLFMNSSTINPMTNLLYPSPNLIYPIIPDYISLASHIHRHLPGSTTNLSVPNYLCNNNNVVYGPTQGQAADSHPTNGET